MSPELTTNARMHDGPLRAVHRARMVKAIIRSVYAEAGQFDRAIDTIQEALRLGPGTPAETAMRDREELYKRHRPCRQSSEPTCNPHALRPVSKRN